MRKPTPAESAPIDTPVPRTFFSRMFRWGIGFWLLLWIGAACVFSDAQCNIKGLPPARLGVASSSVICSIGRDHVSPKHYFNLNSPPTFIWSQDYPSPPGERFTLRRILMLVGPLGLYPIGENLIIIFPISGFLWLWLVCGWWLEAKRKHERIFRSAVRIAILVLLPALSLVAGYIAGYISKQEGDSARCYLNIRNIQQAMRGYQSTHELIDGSAVPWAAIFGPGGYMSKPRCPSGCEYELSPVVPEIGKPAARCPNPEHRRRLEERGTVGW